MSELKESAQAHTVPSRHNLFMVPPAHAFIQARLLLVGYFAAAVLPTLVIFQCTSPATSRPYVTLPNDFDRVAASVKEWQNKAEQYNFDRIHIASLLVLSA